LSRFRVAIPSFTRIFCLLTQREFSDAKKPTTSAICSGSLTLPEGLALANVLMSSSFLPFRNRSVPVGPGDKAFTRIPSFPSFFVSRKGWRFAKCADGSQPHPQPPSENNRRLTPPIQGPKKPGQLDADELRLT